MNSRNINSLVAGSVVGISALVAGCEQQVIRVDINEPSGYRVSVDDKPQEMYTGKALEIPLLKEKTLSFIKI